MNEAFLKAYERELALLYDRGKEFSQDYPGIASRLGGLIQGNLDPAVDGLMQGAAFLAARVQLQIDREFDTFSRELLDQLLPNILAPTPSTLMAQVDVDASTNESTEAQRYDVGSYLDARFVERDQRIQCRYRLSAPLEIWPIEIRDVTYFSGPGRFQALGLDPHPDTSGGLMVSIKRRASGKSGMKDLSISSLNVHLSGDLSDAGALYEAIFAQTLRASIRIEDANGDPIIVPLRPDQIEPVGLDENEAFFPEDSRVFRGFTLIREFFMFQKKFLGFRLKDIGDIVAADHSGTLQLLFELDNVRADLVPRIDGDDFALFCVPAVNLFEENAGQISLDVRKNEYHVIPVSSPSENYEVHKIREVSAIYSDSPEKAPVYPLYGAPGELGPDAKTLCYTARQQSRRRTEADRRTGRKNEYRGVETLLSFYEPGGLDDAKVSKLQVKTLASNRHLPLHLPIGQAGADFYLAEDTSINLSCIAGPTPPKPSVIRSKRQASEEGKIPWRLISFLSLNFLGLDTRTEGGGAAGLRELLGIFVDLDSPVNAQQLNGIEKLETRPIVRSVKRGNRYHSARGLEVILTFDERAFETSTVVLISAVLERFFAEYAPVNSFTQTVVVSKQRGKLKTWPPRSGQGPIL